MRLPAARPVLTRSHWEHAITRWLLAAFVITSLNAPAAAQERVDLELMTYPRVAAAKYGTTEAVRDIVDTRTATRRPT